MLKRKPEIKHVPYQGLDENPLSFVELLVIDSILELDKSGQDATGKTVTHFLEAKLKREVIESQVYRALKVLAEPGRGLLETIDQIKNKRAPPSKPYRVTKLGKAAHAKTKAHYLEVGKYLGTG